MKESLSVVVSLDARRKQHRRDLLTQRLRNLPSMQLFVALWFGAAAFAAACLVGALMMTTLRHGWAGLAIGIMAGAGITWRIAGRWVQKVGRPAPPERTPLRRLER